MQNLNNLCENNNIENISGTTSAAIKRRITLNKEIKEGDFISFLKQKIGIEEKKNGPKLKDKKKQEEGCPCCDCFWKKSKKLEDDLGGKSKEKKLEDKGGAQEGA